MYKAIPDAGVLRIYNVESSGSSVYFANAFAANDPESTLMVWQMLRKRYEMDSYFVVINNRADRQSRSLQLADFSLRLECRHFFIVGAGTDYLVGLMLKKGIPQEKITDLGGKSLISSLRQ
jgi:hypothetical protein